ncbi:unnamed protein product [Spirodela intermedia]|uniref:Uncharacterized protein n=1 Tax=Spirodela intermedia TaxID=51605 RepID=A0A7I8ISL0_SPIIN|nr:unnamed protein product [Spirodela intermedia]CAA6660961.1 unnamed protein product [Spirodela intermedia]
MAHVSDIKLIRTDTTLDLSQKAEKGADVAAAELLRHVGVVQITWKVMERFSGGRFNSRLGPRIAELVPPLLTG